MNWAEERDDLLGLTWLDGVGDDPRVGDPAGGYSSKPNNVVDKSRAFALRIITFTRKLRNDGWVGLSEQLFDAGTSIGANMSEAQQAESRKDFIHKTRIAAKEAKESKYWLSLCRDAPELFYTEGLWEQADELNAILGAIIRRAIENDPKRKGK